MGKRQIAEGWHEFSFLRQVWRRFDRPGPRDRVGLGDDASAYRPVPGALELVTCDMLVEQVHWSWSWATAAQVGAKAAAVNLSDVAAMGGRPERAYLFLALPSSFAQARALQLVGAVDAELKKYGARLAGGDTVRSPGPVMVGLTLQGIAAGERIFTRAGARPGDRLLVTGHLGAAAAGLWELQHGRSLGSIAGPLTAKLLNPIPRLREAQRLARLGGVHALLDLSDGLAGDVRRLAEASRVGIRIDADRLPMLEETRRTARAMRKPDWLLAATGGEDYELLFSVSKASSGALAAAVRKLGTACTDIGEVVAAGGGLRVRTSAGKSLALPAGWEHA